MVVEKEELRNGGDTWCSFCFWGNHCVCDKLCDDFTLLEEEHRESLLQVLEDGLCRSVSQYLVDKVVDNLKVDQD